MTEGVNIKTSCGVDRVEFLPRGSRSGIKPGKNDELSYDVVVLDEDGVEHIFDAVIFACSSPSMNRALHGYGQPLPGSTVLENNNNGLDTGSNSGILSWIGGQIEKLTLAATLYTTDRDKIFQRGIVHSDADAIFPEKYKDYICNNSCNAYVVDEDDPDNLENHFVLSSWAPTVSKEVREKNPMFVTYGPKEYDEIDSEWVVTSKEAHPCLTITQMMSAVVIWPFFNGSRDGQCYFCASSITPGNGHDLSFLSGLIVSCELGASYPFPNDERAAKDFQRLKKMMLGPFR